MIDKGVFLNEWALLCERFRKTGEKEPSQPMRRRYFKYLHERLTTDGFVAACERIYAESEFFPKPADFVPTDGADSAAEQWEKLLPLLRNASSPLDSLNEPARRAVRSMGGLARIGEDESKLHFKMSTFFDLYDGYCEHETRLPEVTDQSPETLRKLGLGTGP